MIDLVDQEFAKLGKIPRGSHQGMGISSMTHLNLHTQQARDTTFGRIKVIHSIEYLLCSTGYIGHNHELMRMVLPCSVLKNERIHPDKTIPQISTRQRIQ